MQVSVETGEGLERRMRVDLPSERIQGEVDKRLQQLSRSARLPGFRPGKVPVKLLRQRYGDQVEAEVVGEMIQSTFPEAVSRESLRPAGQPRFEPDIDRAERRFAYTAVFEVLPELELASLEGQVVKRPVAEVTDGDLDTMLQSLREQRKTWQAAERPSQSGDRLVISFTGTMDGEPFDGGSGEGNQIVLGSGRMIPGFEDGLIGASAGETRTIDLTFPEDYQKESLAGRPARFEVKVDAVEAPVLPDLDADFARGFGIEDGDVDRLRADVRNNMDRELRQRIDARVKEQVMDLLISQNPIDIPTILVHQEIHSLKEQMRQNMGGSRMELPDSLFEDSARRRVALGLIIAEVVKRQGIKADPQRVRAAVEDLAATYEDPGEVMDYYYGSRDRLAPVESLVLEEQVVDWVLGHVSVEEEPATFAQITEPAHRG
jgi:trigger factor